MSRGRMRCSVLPDESGSDNNDNTSKAKCARRVDASCSSAGGTRNTKGICEQIKTTFLKMLQRKHGIWNKTLTRIDDDYIHASYVTVSSDLTYICAQGPLLNTIQDFWIMAIQEETNVILQLCQQKENDREQCSDYLPNETAGWKEYGAVRVRITEPTSGIVTLKKVTRTKIEASYSDKIQEVVHIAYAGWPDHFVPDSASTCREIYTMLHKYYGRKPIIVHCSAGIGRTGTFVAVELAMAKLRNNETCIVVDVTKKLREQRLHAIQNDLQYLFIYRMMVELLIEEGLLSRDQHAIDFLKDYDSLITRKRKERILKDN
ncbi:protein-tyrosine phosphatase containing protein [Wuchereria bancrofti]|uniref:Protein-tyrosine phosphatase containing protein n=1 Tax=Wuchereria bancrofti TaxID=6293 RepID=J9ET80_WUCBA|nr:protein-tyrosine phosphatase containing protein [Wuchereria bancrofti]